MAQPRSHACANMVQCRSARRKSIARSAHERQPEAGTLPDAGEMRLQGNRNRLSIGVWNTAFVENALIEENRQPDDVWLQVLVQAREDLIERTVESLVGAKKAIIHLYNSTSPAQRRVVFGMSKQQILDVAVYAPRAKWIYGRLPRLKRARR